MVIEINNCDIINYGINNCISNLATIESNICTCDILLTTLVMYFSEKFGNIQYLVYFVIIINNLSANAFIKQVSVSSFTWRGIFSRWYSEDINIRPCHFETNDAHPQRQRSDYIKGEPGDQPFLSFTSFTCSTITQKISPNWLRLRYIEGEHVLKGSIIIFLRAFSRICPRLLD